MGSHERRSRNKQCNIYIAMILQRKPQPPKKGPREGPSMGFACDFAEVVISFLSIRVEYRIESCTHDDTGSAFYRTSYSVRVSV